MAQILSAQTCNPKVVESNSDEQQVIDLGRELSSAILQSNLEVIDRLVSDDYVQINSDGVVSNKASLVASAKNMESIPEGIRPSPILSYDDLKVRVCANTAVFTGRSIVKQQFATYGEVEKKRQPRETKSEYRFTTVLVKKDDKWQIVSSQTTRVPENINGH